MIETVITVTPFVAGLAVWFFVVYENHESDCPLTTELGMPGLYNGRSLLGPGRQLHRTFMLTGLWYVATEVVLPLLMIGVALLWFGTDVFGSDLDFTIQYILGTTIGTSYMCSQKYTLSPTRKRVVHLWKDRIYPVSCLIDLEMIHVVIAKIVGYALIIASLLLVLTIAVKVTS